MKQLNVRLSDEEYAGLRSRAFRSERSISAFVRELIVGGSVVGLPEMPPAATVPLEEKPPVTVMPARKAAVDSHRHVAESAGPVSKCRCGAVRVAGEWRVL